MSKRINRILTIEPNDVTKNNLYVTWQPAKGKNEVVSA